MVGGTIIVYGSGGLGDFVSTWPMLRSQSATIVVKPEWGRLAKMFLPCVHPESDAPWKRFLEGKEPPPRYIGDFSKLIVRAHDEVIEHHKVDCDKLQKLARQVREDVTVEIRNFTDREGNPIHPEPHRWSATGHGLFHVGAGRLRFFDNPPTPFPDKEWPLETSLSFAQLMRRDRNAPVDLIAGPDQQQQWSSRETAQFLNAGGIFSQSIEDLACRIRAARFFVGFDSGPTHLAAQLGKRTNVFLGPTGRGAYDKRPSLVSCEPWGPCVTIMAPDETVPPREKVALRWLVPHDAAKLVVIA